MDRLLRNQIKIYSSNLQRNNDTSLLTEGFRNVRHTCASNCPETTNKLNLADLRPDDQSKKLNN